MDMQNVSNLQIPEGVVRTIHDKNNRLLWGRVAYDTKYVGDTVQNGTPAPDTPVPVQVVTGAQTVTISDGADSEVFPISLGSTELCKIGNYQDYIYKSGDDWYVHKDVDKIILTGANEEKWIKYGDGIFYTDPPLSGMKMPVNNNIIPFSQYYKGVNSSATISSFISDASAMNYALNVHTSSVLVRIKNIDFTQVSQLSNWLSTHNTTVYYVLATHTDAKITDSTLIGQLNAVHQWLTRYGYNATVSGNLPIIINKTNL